MGKAEKVIRAVLDTNVVISALLFEGFVSRLLTYCKDKKFQWLVSSAVLKEYIRVLHYPKFQLSAEEIERLVHQEILPYLQPVSPSPMEPVILKDPSDDMFLACAIKGNAHYLVSGDRHLLNLKHYRGIPIIATRKFLEILE